MLHAKFVTSKFWKNDTEPFCWLQQHQMVIIIDKPCSYCELFMDTFRPLDSFFRSLLSKTAKFVFMIGCHVIFFPSCITLFRHYSYFLVFFAETNGTVFLYNRLYYNMTRSYIYVYTWLDQNRKCIQGECTLLSWWSFVRGFLFQAWDVSTILFMYLLTKYHIQHNKT